ncbi:dTDP-4-dehydrorhamnose reductase [Methanocella conradii]|uniref:dTDP-4-dehydrorhamnose reductase n=1 Tax=Methanocella conradii TaxID=1175444 RepID=UPI0024B390C9|nr:dTDP-4-dehydrorhamnose reductase [Methanocella conradii]MDI6898173.1 dTDP-4-dehydrorhamnose reductase [Methanocella conradii]
MILVTGSGLLGSDMIRVLRREHEVVGTYNKTPKEGTIRLDITDREGTIRAIRELKPEYVVHTAALTNVDYCEDHEAEAMAVNGQGTKNVVDAARAAGSKVVYVSTDYVFDGSRGMYREDDDVCPISAYARSKLMGELHVEEMEDFIIARTSVVYGNARQNFVSWVRDSLAKGQRIKVVTDQFNSPTLSYDCAEAVAALIRSGASGIYHTAGSERISRYEFARKIALFYGLDLGLIEPVPTSALSQKARRPMDSSLDVTRISAYHRMLNIMEGLRKMEEVK